jgi:dUTP pyrophosphatase
MQVNIKKLNKKAVMPTKAHPTDAGFDMVAVTKVATDKYIEFGTGLAIEIPVGYVGFVFANSRVSKYDLDLANAVAVIDSGYTGEIRLRYKHTIQPQTAFKAVKTKYFDLTKDIEPVPILFTPKEFNVGDVVGQLIILPIPSIEFNEVTELTETERGDGGFGSTEAKELVQATAPTVLPTDVQFKAPKKRGRKPKKK